MKAFLAVINYKYEILAIDDRKDIWRIWFNGMEPNIQKLIGDEPEYYNAIRLLRAKRELYE